MILTSSTTPARCGIIVGDFGPALSMFGELEARAQHCGVGADERVTLPADHLGRDRLPLERANCGL